jgi:hypothetical protein
MCASAFFYATDFLRLFSIFRPNQKTKDSCQKQADAYQFPKTMGAGFGTVANLFHQTKSK